MKEMNCRILLAIALICCSSCAQLSLFQDAKTLGTGKLSLGGIISGYGINDRDGNDDIVLPYLAGQGIYGVSEKVDLQLSVSLAGGILLAPKFQILGNQESKWALALNPGAELNLSSFESEGIGIFRSHYSGIASYHPSNKLSIFFEPRYITQYRTDQINDAFYGASSGIILKASSSIDLSFGGSFYEVKHTSEQLYQLGMGINFNLR